MQKKKTRGLTLVEIIVVLIIIGIVALFALPNIPGMRNRAERKGCIGNLWLIKMAKDQWALDENKISGTDVEWSNLITDYIDKRPVCPTTKTSASYGVNPGKVGENPTCTETGHVVE